MDFLFMASRRPAFVFALATRYSPLAPQASHRTSRTWTPSTSSTTWFVSDLQFPQYASIGLPGIYGTCTSFQRIIIPKLTAEGHFGFTLSVSSSYLFAAEFLGTSLKLSGFIAVYCSRWDVRPKRVPSEGHYRVVARLPLKSRSLESEIVCSEGGISC